jgi:hypothetical protein
MLGAQDALLGLRIAFASAKNPNCTVAVMARRQNSASKWLMSPKDLDAPHHAAMIGRKVSARMHRTAIVPYQEAAHAPLMTVDKFVLLGMTKHGV